MASKRPNYYKISSVFKNPKRTWFSLSIPAKRRFRLLLGVIGVYSVISVLVGSMFFNSNLVESTQSKELAFISSSIRFENEKQQYKIGDEVKIVLTIQNTSIVESLNDLEVDVLSTRDAVEWKTSLPQNNPQSAPIQVSNKQTFKYGLLSNGERSEYLISGFLRDDQVDFLTILVRVRYKNQLGQQEITTNTISTNLENGKIALNRNVVIRTDQDSYQTGQEVSILVAVVDVQLEQNQLPIGRIFLNQNQSVQTKTVLDCIFNANKTCINKADGLSPGTYTAMFISQDEKILSNIISFSVNGANQEIVTPSSATSLNSPFGISSINGIAPIIATRVLSQNEPYNPNLSCKFEIFREENIINEIITPLKQDRSCTTELNLGLVDNQGGVYKIRLAGSNFEKFVSILPPSFTTLPVRNLTSNLEVGQAVKIRVSDIYVDTKQSTSTSTSSSSSTGLTTVSRILNQPEELVKEAEQQASKKSNGNQIGSIQNQTSQGQSSSFSQGNINTPSINPVPSVTELLKNQTKRATIKIYDRFRQRLINVEGINGLPILSNNDILETEIPGEYFNQSGTYQIIVEFEDGQQSDFLTLSIGNNTGFYSLEGIQVDDFSNLQVGKEIKFSVNNIVDFNNQKIPTGSCEAVFYINNNSQNPEVLSGQINDGRCEVVLPAGKITKSGLILVSFTGLGIRNKINQSEQFYISAGTPVNYGDINFEYEPVRQKQANNIIIGPVSDQFGNLATTGGYQLVFSTGEFIPEVIQNIQVNNGFATITFPSSLTEYEELILGFRDREGNELIQKNVVPVNTREKLILPAFPKEIQSNQQIGASLVGVELFEEAQCILSWKTGGNNYQEIIQDYDFTNSRCDIAWNLTQNRDVDRALLGLQLGDRKFNQIVELKNTEAANIFAITPQIRLNEASELEIFLLTSPILDQMGLPIKNGKLTWQYNGKVRQTDIIDGFSSLALLANDLSQNDIRQTFQNNSGQRFLDLDLDVKAGIVSLSQTNNVSIYLDKYDIANQSKNFEIITASNYVKQFSQSIFRFRSPACEVISTDERKQVIRLQSHKQGSDCYVEVDTQTLGQKTLVLTKNGFRFASFTYTVGDITESVEWCKDQDNTRNCFVQIKSPAVFKAKIELTNDSGEVFSFESTNLENTIEIKGNGLNPLKMYNLKLTYNNLANQEIRFYQTILGEKLLTKTEKS